jgi:hypothetical protein
VKSQTCLQVLLERFGCPAVSLSCLKSLSAVPSIAGMTITKDNLRLRRKHHDRREGPYIALGDHVSSCRLVLFEAISFDVGSVRLGIVPRPKQKNVVRVVFRDRDTKLAEARLLYRRSA